MYFVGHLLLLLFFSSPFGWWMLLRVGLFSLPTKCWSLHLLGEVIRRACEPPPPIPAVGSERANPGTCRPTNKGPQSAQKGSEADQEEPPPAPGGDADLAVCKGTGWGVQSKIPMSHGENNPNTFKRNKSYKANSS